MFFFLSKVYLNKLGTGCIWCADSFSLRKHTRGLHLFLGELGRDPVHNVSQAQLWMWSGMSNHIPMQWSLYEIAPCTSLSTASSKTAHTLIPCPDLQCIFGWSHERRVKNPFSSEKISLEKNEGAEWVKWQNECRWLWWWWESHYVSKAQHHIIMIRPASC